MLRFNHSGGLQFLKIREVQFCPALVILLPFVGSESEAFANLPFLFLTHTKNSALIEVSGFPFQGFSSVTQCVKPSSPHSHDGKRENSAVT